MTLTKNIAWYCCKLEKNPKQP